MSIDYDPIRQDFRNFLYLAWQALRLPCPSPLQYDIASYLQHGPKRRGIQAMRGCGKSYMTAAYAAWRLYCDPNTTILVVSAASVRAQEFIRLTRMLLENMPICEHLRPKEDDRDGAFRFDCGARTKVSKDPSVAAYGITSMITGTHTDVIIPDDVETPDNSLTVESRDRLYHKCLEFESMLNPDGDIIYLGTPQTEDSIYNRLGNHYQFLRWPAVYPDPQNERACDRLAPWLLDRLQDENDLEAVPGAPTFPERFPEDVLLERQAIMGPTVYALQMLLDTSLSDADRHPLKLADFIVMPTHPEVAPPRVVWGTSEAVQDIPSVGLGKDRFYRPIFYDDDFQPYQESVMYIDPSGRGQDETGYAVGKLLNGMIFITAAGGLPGGHDEETLLKLANIAKENGVKKVLVEDNFGDGMYTKLLQPVFARVCGPVATEDRRSKGQKERRIIDILEPAMALHRIIIDPKVARDQKLMYQVSHITRDRGSLRHDDRVEALAGVVGYYTEKLGVDAEKIKENQRLAKEAEAAKEFIKSWKNNPLGRLVVAGHQPEPDVVASKKFRSSFKRSRQSRRCW